jgi:hypothetical protein
LNVEFNPLSMIAQTQFLLDALNSCVAIREGCTASCQHEQDGSAAVSRSALDRDTADLCALTARFVARDSASAPPLLALCADMCRAYATEAGAHNGLPASHCQQCISAWQRCEQACRAALASARVA